MAWANHLVFTVLCYCFVYYWSYSVSNWAVHFNLNFYMTTLVMEQRANCDITELDFKC
jgi:hypothetical protein